MATSSMLKAKGLYTFQNYLSAIPEGSLFEAENVVIDRDGVIEPRRGIKVNGTLPDRSKQLLTYRNRILAHYDDAIAFSDGNDPAIFTSYKKRSDFTSNDIDATANTISIILHGLQANDEIIFSSTGDLPSPLVSGVTYYIKNPTQDTFQLTITPDGLTPIDLISSGASFGAASNYAILGASTITNTGSSVVTGDVGLSPGTSITGFPPGTVLGTIHIADASAAQAQIDAMAVYTDLAARPYDVDESGIDLGTLTLSPGVYKYTTSAQLTGTLTLDAGGNSNAEWIFQIGSTLTTASSSVVSIINGGSAANVYWQVGSSATIGTSTTFLGNIIALASITANTSATVDGKLFALTGAVTLDTNITTNITSGGFYTATYDFVFKEVDPNFRIKGIELNSNEYVTTANGIKKLSGLNEFYASDAGPIIALNIDLSIDFTNPNGFLESTNEVAYRVLWVNNDINNNLILGAPSYRAVVYNASAETRNVSISFPVPVGVTTDYSYRIYRTQQNVIGAAGDEHKLVYEASFNPDAAEYDVVTNTITVLDEQPEDLRDSGAPLYTNEFSGEGILQTNARLPIAKDIAVFKSAAFYANTTTAHKFSFTLLGLDSLGSFTISSIVANGGDSDITLSTAAHGIEVGDDIVVVGAGGYDAVIEVLAVAGAVITVDRSAGLVSGTDVRTLFSSYITVNKGTTTNKYYFVGRPEIHDILVGVGGAAINGKYFNIYSYDNKTPYYVWFNDTNVPATDPAIVNKIGIRVDYLTADTTAQVALKLETALNDTGDFDSITTASTVRVATITSGFATNPTNGDLPGSWTFTSVQQGFGEDATKNYIRLSSHPSPATAIEDTARSLVSIVTKNIDDVVSAYYVSNINDLPGSMLLESKLIDTTAFSIIANNPTTGAMFNSNLSTIQFAQNETFPNRVYFSKIQQPEAVPAVNNIDVGPKDKAILRILGLQDSLFILKEEGIYRLTGDNSTNFSVSLFDNSANLIAPDTAAILNNQIYALTSQGVATISETGVGIISRPIENFFNRVTSPDYVNYAKASFGFGYEADRAYLLFTIDKPTDTFATKCYRYNTFTQSWTSWKKESTCGIVEPKMNKLYLGAADIDAVEIERKRFISRDYADREYDRSLTTYSFGFVLDNVDQMEIGDLLEQTQYLTASDYNRLVKKAKQDPYLLMTPTFPEITQTGSNLRQAMEALIAELNLNDTTLITQAFDANLDVDTVTDKITITTHGFLNGDQIKLTGSSLPTPLLANTYYYVVNAATNDFQLTTSLGGIAIDLTVLGSGAATIKELFFTSSVEDFAQNQIEFNMIVEKLNDSTGAFFSDYKLSVGTLNLDILVTEVNKSNNKVQTDTLPILFAGPLKHFKGIKSTVVWAPISLTDPSILKHIREGTFMLENTALAGATVGYASDLSGNFEDIGFNLDGDGNWGESNWGAVAWGGEGIAVPIRTLIPRQKQRCRYIRARFKHRNAFYKYAILGISYTYESTSERAYR